MTGQLKEVCNYELKPELRGELETAILHLDVRKGFKRPVSHSPSAQPASKCLVLCCVGLCHVPSSPHQPLLPSTAPS